MLREDSRYSDTRRLTGNIFVRNVRKEIWRSSVIIFDLTREIQQGGEMKLVNIQTLSGGYKYRPVVISQYATFIPEKGCYDSCNLSVTTMGEKTSLPLAVEEAQSLPKLKDELVFSLIHEIEKSNGGITVVIPEETDISDPPKTPVIKFTKTYRRTADSKD